MVESQRRWLNTATHREFTSSDLRSDDRNQLILNGLRFTSFHLTMAHPLQFVGRQIG